MSHMSDSHPTNQAYLGESQPEVNRSSLPFLIVLIRDSCMLVVINFFVKETLGKKINIIMYVAKSI